MSQQMKSVTPSTHVSKIETKPAITWLFSGNQQSLIVQHDAHQIQWDRSQLNPTALVGYRYYIRPRLRLGLV